MALPLRGAAQIPLDLWIRITVVIRNGLVSFTISPEDDPFPIDQGSADLLSDNVS